MLLRATFPLILLASVFACAEGGNLAPDDDSDGTSATQAAGGPGSGGGPAGSGGEASASNGSSNGSGGDASTSGSTTSSSSSSTATSSSSSSSTASSSTGGLFCGNGVVELGEMCDGANLAGHTCLEQGFQGGGTLTCNSACNGFVTTGCIGTCTPMNLLANGAFDASGGWAFYSENFATPLCSTAACGNGGGTGPYNPPNWVWFGGTADYDEYAYVQQTVVIPTGSATLSMQFDIPACGDSSFGTDAFAVSIDGMELYYTDYFDAQCGVPGWTLLTGDVSQFADGLTHTLLIEGATYDFFTATNFMVDDVQLMGGCP